jgi:nitrogen regulatory protein PII
MPAPAWRAQRLKFCKIPFGDHTMKPMMFVIAYVRKLRAPAVLRALHEAGVGGATAYVVHGMSGDKATFLYSAHPFEPAHLPEAVKIEVVCAEDMTDQIVGVIANKAKTGESGDGVITIQRVERFMRIREM